MSDKNDLKFPEGFLWGTSTSAYQIEGGNHNDWSEWEKSERRKAWLAHKKKDVADFICGQACNSYHRHKEDFDLALKLNNNAVRLSLEWSRIQPKRDTWNVEEINHYREVLRVARQRGLTTVVTLWHWTNPTWLALEKGWLNKRTVEYFESYVDLIVRELGGLIDYWVTLGEPTMHAFNGYFRGKWPPHRKGMVELWSVLNHLASAHKNAYQTIHKHFPQAQVSIAMLTNYFEPARHWLPLEWLLAKLANYFGNFYFLNKIEKELDFVGIDYYFHDRLVWYPPFRRNKNRRVSDTGWEIYPEGLYHILKMLHKKYQKPIIILENGLADEQDKYRSDFIRHHLKYLHKALSEGVDVRGYFYWSLLDNFEWTEGFAPKFGLYAVDRKTMARSPRPSTTVYAEICKNNSLSL